MKTSIKNEFKIKLDAVPIWVQIYPQVLTSTEFEYYCYHSKKNKMKGSAVKLTRRDKKAIKEIENAYKVKKGKSIHYRHVTVEQILKRFGGEKLGYGHSREVYALNDSDNLVIKIANMQEFGHHMNIMEWQNWLSCEHWTNFSKWLAPCYAINVPGSILIQHRVSPITSRDQLPDRIPKCLIDRKIQNFGLLGSQIVCVDYSFINFQAYSKSNPETQKAKWWSELGRKKNGQLIFSKKENNFDEIFNKF